MRVVQKFCSLLISLLILGASANAQTGLRLGLALEPPHLDPTASAAAAIDEIVYANVFEGLTRIAENGQVQPSLATRWVRNPQATVWQFFLKSGVRFHDGQWLTPEVVAASLMRINADNSQNAQKKLFQAIQSVQPLADSIVIRLAQPVADLPWRLAWGDAVIVHPDSAPNNKQRPVGTGPFQFVAWERGQAVTLQASRSDSELARVSFVFISDPTAAALALQSGEIDGFANFPAPELLQSFEQDPNFTVAVGVTEGETLLALNHRNRWLAQTRFRRALSLAIDRAAINQLAVAGYGTLIDSHFSPQQAGFVDLSANREYKPEQARRIIQSLAGQENIQLRLVLPPPSYARRAGELIATQLKAIGIEIEVALVDWGSWLSEVFRSYDFDLTIIAHTEPLDIGIYARPDYYFGYQSPRFNRIFAQYESAVDDAKRLDALQQLQRILAQDHANIFLFMLPKLGIWRKNYRGLWQNAPLQANDVTGVRILPLSKP